METLVLSPLEIVESPFTRYELPPEGITTLGYVVRRMHKTAILSGVNQVVKEKQYPHALSQIAYYTAAAAVSFGTLYYEPQKDEIGATVTEVDPETEAIVTATLVNRAPHDHFTYAVQMPDRARFDGFEQTGESRISIRGWVLPATARFSYVAADESYRAELTGTITREVVPRIVGPWHSRAYGSLELSDSDGNVGHLKLNRNAQAIITVSCASGRTILHREVKVT